MTTMSNKLDRFTKVSIKRRRKVLKWLTNQTEEVVLLAFEGQKKQLFSLSKVNEDNKSVLYLAALYLAAEHLYSLYHAQKNKNRTIDIHAVKGATSIKAKKFKRSIQSEKYDRLLNMKNKILVLKDEENLSFRQISKFLKKYHRLEVSHSYIATFYHKIKGKK